MNNILFNYAKKKKKSKNMNKNNRIKNNNSKKNKLNDMLNFLSKKMKINTNDEMIKNLPIFNKHYKDIKKFMTSIDLKNMTMDEVIDIIMKFKNYKKNRKFIKFRTIDDSLKFDCKNESEVAIIIPYRNREEHLDKLKKHFKNTNFDIYIIEQYDTQRFNRGILLNIGYYLAKKNKNYKYYIFHDVDSLPDEDLIKQYCYTGDKIIHYASPYLDYKYSFPNFLGGVIGMSGEVFEKINGFPNRIYGWGGEDDMVYNRLAKNNLIVYRPRKGKYILLDHPQATEEEEYPERWEGVLRDLIEWKQDGLKEGDKEVLDNHFILMYESFEKNPNIYLYKVKIPIQHPIKLQYISLMRPLITWKEVKNNILDTFTEPELFINSESKNKENKVFNKLIEEKIDLYDVSLTHLSAPFGAKKDDNKLNLKNKEYTKKDLEKSLKFIFDTYRDILYLRIRQNHIEFAFHLYNSEFSSDWYKYVNFPNGMNVEEFMKKKQKNLPSKTEKLVSPNKWTANNCVVSFEDWSSYGNPTEYVKGIYEMFIKMVEKYKVIPDCDILINRKDFQFLHINPERYAYTHVYPENVKIPNPPLKYWFLCSQSSSKNNLDIPIPSADEFKNALKLAKNNNNNNKFNKKEFESKENKLFFRGSTTGCGLNENTNPRLRLYMISDILNKEGDEFFDIGLAMFTKKIKVNDFEVGYLDLNKYKYLKKDFVDMSVWKKYKYFLNIEGNVAAYRLPILFSYGGIVVQAESDYYMWFEPLLKDGEDYILLKKEIYMKEGDSIEESAKKVKEFFSKIKKENKNMEKIAENGFNFYKKYLCKDSILEYCFTLCYNINKKIS